MLSWCRVHEKVWRQSLQHSRGRELHECPVRDAAGAGAGGEGPARSGRACVRGEGAGSRNRPSAPDGGGPASRSGALRTATFSSVRAIAARAARQAEPLPRDDRPLDFR